MNHIHDWDNARFGPGWCIVFRVHCLGQCFWTYHFSFFGSSIFPVINQIHIFSDLPHIVGSLPNFFPGCTVKGPDTVSFATFHKPPILYTTVIVVAYHHFMLRRGGMLDHFTLVSNHTRIITHYGLPDQVPDRILDYQGIKGHDTERVIRHRTIFHFFPRTDKVGIVGLP